MRLFKGAWLWIPLCLHTFPTAAEVQLIPHRGETLPKELPFLDEHGGKVSLEQELEGHPLLLVPVYFSCPNLCNLTLERLATSLDETPPSASAVHVVVVSIDPRDSPQGAREKKKQLLSHLSPESLAAQWDFLSASEPTIRRLLSALGIPFVYDQNTGQFNHPSVAVVVTPGGKISQYLYGLDFPRADLIAALQQAAREKTSTPLARFLLYCFHYDPASSAHGQQVTHAMQACGVLSVTMIAGLILWLVRRVRSREAASP